MIAPVLIAASVALISLQVDPADPIVFPREDGIIYDIQHLTGEIGFGSRNAFDGFGRLTINGVLYKTTRPFELIDHDDQWGPRTVAAPPIELQWPAGEPLGLVVSRKIYVPWSAKRNYARYYDRIHNISGVEQTINIRFGGMIGRIDAALPELIHRRNGFAVITLDPLDDAAPRVGILFERGISSRASTADNSIDADFEFTPTMYDLASRYIITLKPDEEIAIVNFITHRPTPTSTPDGVNAQSIDGAPAASEGPTLAATMDEELEKLGKQPDWENLSWDEIVLIMNMFADTDVNMDGRVNILDMIAIRNDLGEDPASGDANPRADVNADTFINILDMILVRNDLGWPF